MFGQDYDLKLINFKNEVDKIGCSGYTYKLDFTKSSVFKGLESINKEGTKVFIDPKATIFLLGSVMDCRKDNLSSRFVFHNPNEKLLAAAANYLVYRN